MLIRQGTCKVFGSQVACPHRRSALEAMCEESLQGVRRADDSGVREQNENSQTGEGRESHKCRISCPARVRQQPPSRV